MTLLRTRGYGDLWQKPLAFQGDDGSLVTDADGLHAIIKKEWGAVYDGNVQDPTAAVARLLAGYNEHILDRQPMLVREVSGEDLHSAVVAMGDSSAGLDGWSPADLKLITKRPWRWVARMLNLCEHGSRWPKGMQEARAAFLAKPDTDGTKALDYRIITVLAGIYRAWVAARLHSLQDWEDGWALGEMYGGANGQCCPRGLLQYGLSSWW